MVYYASMANIKPQRRSSIQAGITEKLHCGRAGITRNNRLEEGRHELYAIALSELPSTLRGGART
jgi:hypothetical protein